MAEIERTDNQADKAKAKPPTKPGSVVVIGSVVLETGTFDPHKPVLVDQAEQLFRTQVAESHGSGQLTNVTLKGITHKVGNSVAYEFSGQVG